MSYSRLKCLDSMELQYACCLPEASFRLIYELGCISERCTRPAIPRPDEADRARALALLGLLCEHRSFDVRHQECLSYTVTSTGTDVFNLAASWRDTSRLDEAA
ncbi:MAG: hypothetical protein JWQ90_492 [Hydrocarboniphaga sp.]|uniref:hypothetical protein n=1 Tax=Hydrocarboniphaga sp. TaxID=2033016 RepID=UPI00260A5575|nr:hypothetical protein [Hydrocarboniphaga sp.]MDB5968042.1 hypothetical protein [Hydrocarboniphaga sp.]